MGAFQNVFGETVTDIQYVVQPVTNRLSKFDLYLTIKETNTVAIPTNGDFTSEDLYLVVTDQDLNEVFYKTNAQLSSRTSSNITITLEEALTDRTKRLSYAFRKTANNQLLQKGKIVVDFAAYHTP